MLEKEELDEFELPEPTIVIFSQDDHLLVGFAVKSVQDLIGGPLDPAPQGLILSSEVLETIEDFYELELKLHGEIGEKLYEQAKLQGVKYRISTRGLFMSLCTKLNPATLEWLRQMGAMDRPPL